MLWLNGKLINQDHAKISPADRGFLLGDGLFETILIKNGKLEFINQHLKRLYAGMNAIYIKIPYDMAQLSVAVVELLTATNFDNASIRITVTRGYACAGSARGITINDNLNPTVMITATPYIKTNHKPLSVMISQYRRNENSPLCQVKALNYLDNIMARNQAVMAGFDDAIMLNSKGNISCATVANIFIDIDGKIITPPLSDGALAGIMRQNIIDMAENTTNQVKQSTIKIDDLYKADEIFITNSLIGKQQVILS